MQSAFVILNGVDITDQCRGVEELSEKIYFDNELKGYLREIEGDLTINGDAYRFIQERFKNDFDSPIPISISVFNPHNEVYENVFNGLIFTSDCEFDLYANEVVCQLVDKTFFAKINNNKNVKFTINAGLSKLGVDITSRGGEIDYQIIGRLWANPTLSELPSNYGNLPNSLPTGRYTKASTLYQALDYLVAAMTDGDVEFFSSYLTDVSTDRNYVILSGEQVRMESTSFAKRPNVSWVELFGDLSRQFSLLMAVEEYASGQFRIRVEPYEFWKQQQAIDLFDVKPRVKERIDTAMLPANVVVGSAKVSKKLPIPSADMFSKSLLSTSWVPTNASFYFDFVPETPFIYHWQEEYNYQYQSNVDSTQAFRLQRLITDTKIYSYQVAQYWARFIVSGFDTEGDVDITYDEDIFLIHSTEELPRVSVPFVRRPVIFQEPFFFIINREINNINTIYRNLNSIPSSVTLLFQAITSQSFRAHYESSGTASTAQYFDQFGLNLRTLHNVLSFPLAGDFAGNTTYYGSSGIPTLNNIELEPPQIAPNIGNRFMRVVNGFNDVSIQGFDNSGNYNAVNAYWTVAVAGLYSFRLFLEWWSRNYFNVGLAQWDSSGTLKRYFQFGQNFNSLGNYNYNPNKRWIGTSRVSIGDSAPTFINNYRTFDSTIGAYTANAGDVFQLILEAEVFKDWTAIQETLVLFSENSFWELFQTSVGGGTIIQTNTGSNNIVENELEANVPLNVWNDIKSNPFRKYSYLVSDDGTRRTGFLKDFTRSIISGNFKGITIPERPLPPDNQTIESLPIEDEIPDPETEEEE